MEQMSDHFIGYVAGYFADTNSGLKNSEIDRLFDEYVVKFRKGEQKQVFFNTKKEKMAYYLKRFSGKEQYQIIEELCQLGRLRDKEKNYEILTQLQKNYWRFSDYELMDVDLVQETEGLLEKYPSVRQQLNLALGKIDQEIFERNVLDDMRLALELLIKNLLSTDKSLENQIKDLGGSLSKVGVPKEIRNMFVTLIDYYCKYQNKYSKHQDSDKRIEKSDVEFIVEMTNVMMKYLIIRLGEQ